MIFRRRRAHGTRLSVKRGSVAPKPLVTQAVHPPDYPLLGLIIGLSLFGLLMVYDASVVVAAARFGSKFYFVQQQGMNLLIGLVLLFVAMRIDYHFWRKLALLSLVVGIGMLLAVFIPGLGVTVYGAKRWLDIGFTTLQPAYLLCFSFILYFADWLSGEKPERQTLEKGLIPFAVLLGAVLFVVVILQKDLGTGLILAFTAMAIYFLSGAPLRHFIYLAPPALLAGILAIVIAPHRINRIITFLNLGGDDKSLTTDYHINQVMIALGSGGWLGVGLGQSRQKYQYIPEVQTDSIFAILGEELGFIGSFFLVTVFAYILWRGIRIAMLAPDMFGRLLVGGAMSLIGVQMFVNLFAMTKIIPLTGVPLPFISNGGTSLIVLLFSVGIVLNVSRQLEPR
jgi:cell division protein FtsW